MQKKYDNFINSLISELSTFVQFEPEVLRHHRSRRLVAVMLREKLTHIGEVLVRQTVVC